eukprot:365994-Chlamydomonas_euryale.AAC.15
MDSRACWCGRCHRIVPSMVFHVSSAAGQTRLNMSACPRHAAPPLRACCWDDSSPFLDPPACLLRARAPAGASNMVGDNAGEPSPWPDEARPRPGKLLMFPWKQGEWVDAEPNMHLLSYGLQRDSGPVSNPTQRDSGPVSNPTQRDSGHVSNPTQRDFGHLSNPILRGSDSRGPGSGDLDDGGRDV